MKRLVVLFAALALSGSSAQALRLPGAPRCTIFPKTNAWNTRVDALPVAANSAAIIQSIGTSVGLHADFGSGLYDGGVIGIPFDVVTKKTPRTTRIVRVRGRERPRPYPIPKTVHIESGSDHHALLLDKDACRLYELGGLARSGGRWTAWAGATWSLRSNKVRPADWTSADAAGLPIFPGLARYDEVARGVIDHALRFTVQRSRRAYVYPARHYASSLTDPEPAADGTARPPEGELRRQRLPAPGARRAHRAEALRDDGRRQRLELVHQRRPERALEQRRPAHARTREGLELRGRRHVVDPSVGKIRAASVNVPTTMKTILILALFIVLFASGCGSGYGGGGNTSRAAGRRRTPATAAPLTSISKLEVASRAAASLAAEPVHAAAGRRSVPPSRRRLIDATAANHPTGGVAPRRRDKAANSRPRDELAQRHRAADDVPADVVPVVRGEVARRHDVASEDQVAEAGREALDLRFDRVGRVAVPVVGTWQ